MGNTWKSRAKLGEFDEDRRVASLFSKNEPVERQAKARGNTCRVDKVTQHGIGR